MSHFSHKDIVSSWTKYEQGKLENIRARRKRCKLIELTIFLCATGSLIGFASQKKNSDYFPEFFAGYIATNTALLYAEAQQSEKYKKEAQQLAMEREHFFNQFRY